MSLSFRQIGLRSRMTARLAVEPSIYGNISGNGSDLGYPKGKLEKLTVYRRWYQEPGTLAFGKNVKEMLGSAELGIIPENGVGAITEEAIVSELNSRNVFGLAQQPTITKDAAIIGGVCLALFRFKHPFLYTEPFYFTKKYDWDALLYVATYQAQHALGTKSEHGVDWWKYKAIDGQTPVLTSDYYGKAVYPYRGSGLARPLGSKMRI